MNNALTFDVEEYFHAEAFAGVLRPDEWPTLESRVVDTTERLLDILDYTGVRATFFILGWVAERQPALVRDIAARDHEVACHGYGHRMIQHLTRPEFAADVARAKAALEAASGRPVIGYRAPTFSVMRETLWSLDVLCEAGFRYDSSIFPIVHDRYGIPDAPRFPHRRRTASGAEIAEFPLSTVTVAGRWRVPVAGGGYFRLAPYWLTRRAIQRLNEKEQQPAMVYLHPWEMDTTQPRMPVGWLTRLRHSVNVERTEAKLRRLLRDFAFAPAADVLAETGLLVPGDAR
ncbi:MAG TPA: XrtA system polysaccharide deacetylase [Candidatus Limnocylindrales bacterium]|nr:XrtA system polysaccharide deacetylase [Candidatus Limnocylindrales bacterium]